MYESRFSIRLLAFGAVLLTQGLSAGVSECMLCFEAEHANKVTAPIEIWEDGACGAGTCIGIREGAGAEQAYVKEKGRAVYGIRVPKAGRYSLWLRVRWQDVCSNSILLGLDGRPKMTITDGRLGAWHWARGPSMRMKAGSHILTLTNREDGVWVDQIILSSKPIPMPRGPQQSTYVPGQDGPAKACPPLAVSFTCLARAARPKPLHSDLLTHRVSAPSVLAEPRLSVVMIPGRETKFDVWLRRNVQRALSGTVQIDPPTGVEVAPSAVAKWGLGPSDTLRRVRFGLRATAALPIGERPLRVRITHQGTVIPKLATIVRPFEWLIAGPYPFGEDLSISHAIEAEASILAAARGESTARAATWKAVSLDGAYTEFGLLDLRRIFGETQRAAIYALTTIDADRAGEADLFLSVDDHCIAWLNGVEVGRVETSLPATINCTWARVKVRKGGNRLLVKLSQKRGYWEFMARLVPRTPGLVLHGLPAR